MRLHVDSSTASRAPQRSDRRSSAVATSLGRYATRSRMSSGAPRWLMPTTISAIRATLSQKRPDSTARTEVVADERRGRARPAVALAAIEQRSPQRCQLSNSVGIALVDRCGRARRECAPRRVARRRRSRRRRRRPRDAPPASTQFPRPARPTTFTSRPRARASAATSGVHRRVVRRGDDEQRVADMSSVVYRSRVMRNGGVVARRAARCSGAISGATT